MATMKTYHVTNEAGANLRDLPSSTNGKVVAHLPKGALVQVCEDWTAENTVGSTTKYMAVKHGGKWLWCVDKLLREHINYRQRMVTAGKTVYSAIYDGGFSHGGKWATLTEIKKHKETDCIGATAAAGDIAGIVKHGTRVGHRKSDGKGGATKGTIAQAVSGLENLIPGTCDVVWVNKSFSDMPEKCKKPGTILIYDSDNALVAENGIYSCHMTGKKYGKGGCAVLWKGGGYPNKAKVLVAICPKE